mgnify:CR=1 FL=1
MHGGDRIAEVLKAHGVQFIFTLCGGHISPILVGGEELGIFVVTNCILWIKSKEAANITRDAINSELVLCANGAFAVDKDKHDGVLAAQ